MSEIGERLHSLTYLFFSLDLVNVTSLLFQFYAWFDGDRLGWVFNPVLRFITECNLTQRNLTLTFTTKACIRLDIYI